MLRFLLKTHHEEAEHPHDNYSLADALGGLFLTGVILAGLIGLAGYGPLGHPAMQASAARSCTCKLVLAHPVPAAPTKLRG